MKHTISTDGSEVRFIWLDQTDEDDDRLLVAEENGVIAGLTGGEAMAVYVWLQGRLEAAGLL
jgi:hypothetical protein